MRPPPRHPRQLIQDEWGGKRRQDPQKDPSKATTRAENRATQAVIDADTGEQIVRTITKAGTQIDKNRSSHYGYKSHLTDDQRRVIRWALRQRDRGISRARIYRHIRAKNLWISGSMQYPLTENTIGAWELTRSAQAAKGRQWP